MATLPAAGLSLIGGVLLVPWMVRLQGGGAAVSEELRRQAEGGAQHAAARDADPIRGPLELLFLHGIRGSLRARSPLRRYGHLALMPIPMLLALSFLLVHAVNAAFAGPYEDVECQVLKTWKYKGVTNADFACTRSNGERLPEELLERPRAMQFTARARPGALGTWLLDKKSVRAR
ncbi:MAG TPA: hypothetical protein VIY73_12040 [Polyangiaceae bacterium]